MPYHFTKWPCRRMQNMPRQLHASSVPVFVHAHHQAKAQCLHYQLLPLSCCSRVVITVTASWTIMSRVIGWLEPVCAAIICPNSLMASFMSLTRNLLQRIQTVSQRSFKQLYALISTATHHSTLRQIQVSKHNNR